MLAALLLTLLARPASAFETPDAQCAAEAERQERQMGIPSRLLKAISIVESGRYDRERRESYSWPWTVNAQGKGHFFPTKAAAITFVQELKAKGIHSMDVGCMQVNLKYHPNAFANLEEAFEPRANVAYAARFLKGLYDSTKVWPVAASYYHSQTPSLAEAYRKRLMAAWDVERQRQDGHVVPASVMAENLRRFEANRESYQIRTVAEREEARRIADAYRQARLAEWHLRKLQQQMAAQKS
ncbi:MAG: transglycosylase SLT domain-containing protein [Rhodospirillales bacterium]|nr:transglycosylase SLT domain-containing protein [Rhodospirillales bacterium]